LYGVVQKKMKKTKIFDFRIVALTIFAMLLLMPVFALIHEYSHGLICVLNGKEFVFGISIAGGWLSCIGVIEEPTMFRLAGGMITAMIAFATFAILKPKLVGRFKFIAIALVTMGIGEYSVGIMEGYLNDFYMHSQFSGGVSGMLMLTIVMILLYRESKFINERKEIESLR